MSLDIGQTSFLLIVYEISSLHSFAIIYVQLMGLMGIMHGTVLNAIKAHKFMFEPILNQASFGAGMLDIACFCSWKKRL